MLDKNLIQIAGVIDAVEAQMLQQCGVRYLGFPLRLPVHREDLTECEAAAIIKRLTPPVFGVAITYLYQATERQGPRLAPPRNHAHPMTIARSTAHRV